MPKVANSTGGYKDMRSRISQLEFVNKTQAEIINAQRAEILELRSKVYGKFSTKNKVIHNRNLEDEAG